MGDWQVQAGLARLAGGGLLRRKHPRIRWKELRRRYLPWWWPTQGTVTMANPAAVAIVRYRYGGARISTPWTSSPEGSTT